MINGAKIRISFVTTTRDYFCVLLLILLRLKKNSTLKRIKYVYIEIFVVCLAILLLVC